MDLGPCRRAGRCVGIEVRPDHPRNDGRQVAPARPIPESGRVGATHRVGCVMVDHIEWAENYRKRAAACRSIAEVVSSGQFRNCYCELAEHYLSLANLEEDFARRDAVRAWERR
jgi:hypothetical protein